jgi:hypothetical protein
VPKEALILLELQSRQGHIDLFYGDKSHRAGMLYTCEEGFIPQYASMFVTL